MDCRYVDFRLYGGCIMKLTLESAVDFAKGSAMSMKHHFDNDI